MEDKTLGDSNEQHTDEGQAAPKTKVFTQEEVNAIVAKATSKVTRKYEDLGDPDELRQLKTQATKTQEELALKRGEFDKVLQEKLSIKDQEIQKRDNIIREYKIDTPLLQAAAEFKTVNPDQVRALLKGQIKLNETGEAEVIDQKGATQYNDKGVPLTVRDLVKQFVDSNPHFAQPGPAGSNSRSSVGQGTKDVDVSKMSDAEYREYRKSQGLDRN